MLNQGVPDTVHIVELQTPKDSYSYAIRSS